MPIVTPGQGAIVSIFISLGALAVSLFTLWRSHLAGFQPLCTVGEIGIRVFPIRSANLKWYIPSFDTVVTVTNGGARAGTVQSARMALHYPQLPIPKNVEYIYARFEVDTVAFMRTDKNRFSWFDKVIVADWHPFHVLPKQTVSKHLLFESRWEEPVVQDDVRVTLEIFLGSSSGWCPVASWKVLLLKDMWPSLLCGNKHSFFPDGIAETHEQTVPKDLHKYTGTKEMLSEDPLAAPPSYLDYPDNGP